MLEFLKVVLVFIGRVIMKVVRGLRISRVVGILSEISGIREGKE